jgi:hypothetical protein
MRSPEAKKYADAGKPVSRATCEKIENYSPSPTSCSTIKVAPQPAWSDAMISKYFLSTAILALSLSLISCSHQDQKELSNDMKAAGEAAKQTATDAADAAKKAADATDLGDKTKKVAGDVEKAAKNAYDAAADATQKAVDKTKEATDKAVDKTKDTTQKAIDKTKKAPAN